MNIRRKIAAFATATAILITGCATPPTPQELSQIDYGPHPTDYKRSIERYLDAVLKDPESKRIEWIKGPRTMYKKAGPMFGSGITAGWAVCAYVNAKNSYGGYTGGKLSYFLIKNDSVIQAFISTTKNSVESLLAESGCESW